MSVCVPARNEERDIGEAVRAFDRQDHPDLEVIVVDDRSTDGTADILARLGPELSRTRVLRGSEPPDGWLGKPHALHLAAETASGDWILFCDADVRLAPEAVRSVRRALERRRADVAVLMPDLEMVGAGERVALSFLGDAVLWWLPAFLVRFPRPRFASAGAGAFTMIRRELYDRIGGHAALRDAVVDDIGLGVAAKKAGGRILLGIGVDLARVRMYRGLREAFAGFSKNLYVGVKRSPVLLVAAVAALLVSQVAAPALVVAGLLGVALPAEAASRALAATALLLAGRLAVDVRLRRPLLGSLSWPLSALTLAAMMVHSAVRYHRLGGVEWRGRVFRGAPPGTP